MKIVRRPHKPETIQKMSDVKTAKYAVRIAALIERGEKACSNCEIVKPLAAFYPAKRAKGGINYGSWCRECTADQLQKARFALAFNITPDDSDQRNSPPSDSGDETAAG